MSRLGLRPKGCSVVTMLLSSPQQSLRSREKEESAMIISVTKNCRRKKRKRKDEGKNYPWSPTERRVWIIEAVVREALAPGWFGGG